MAHNDQAQLLALLARVRAFHSTAVDLPAVQVALSAARESGKTVAIFSLEMSKEQLVTRLIASEGLVENQRLITGNLRESDWQRIAEAASALSRMDIRIDDNPLLTVADMNAKCRRLENLGLVVIDYLQLMTSAGGKGYSGENRQQVGDQPRRDVFRSGLRLPVAHLRHLHAGIAAGIDAQKWREIHRDIERQTVERAPFADPQSQ
mgnify:CR=1 FL=1